MSAIRFYADEGVVPPTGLTEGGFRQYDVQAVARLELVRTLRDSGAGLDDIRRVWAGVFGGAGERIGVGWDVAGTDEPGRRAARRTGAAGARAVGGVWGISGRSPDGSLSCP